MQFIPSSECESFFAKLGIDSDGLIPGSRGADRFKTLFDDREGQVDHAGGRFYAVFSGFTEAEAKSACQQVGAHAVPCDAYSR
jgi:hypothetical protein